VATVVYHSIEWPYFSEGDRTRIQYALPDKTLLTTVLLPGFGSSQATTSQKSACNFGVLAKTACSPDSGLHGTPVEWLVPR